MVNSIKRCKNNWHWCQSWLAESYKSLVVIFWGEGAAKMISIQTNQIISHKNSEYGFLFHRQCLFPDFLSELFSSVSLDYHCCFHLNFLIIGNDTFYLPSSSRICLFTDFWSPDRTLDFHIKLIYLIYYKNLQSYWWQIFRH